MTPTLQNTILNGDCIELMRKLEWGSVDFILTDPPYITHYRGRDGRTIANDDNSRWLKPAFNQMHRVLRYGGFCLSFYGWAKIDLLMDAWRAAGFSIVGHVVFRKRYASSERYFRYTHEQAYLLAKGNATPPTQPIADVIDFDYTGNRLHPTQKPVQALRPLIESFCPPGGLVLDPFCRSGSTLVAARDTGRNWLGIELSKEHFETVARRLTGERTAAA
ncbi:DNA methyltransferase [Silvimonas sp.]|uniref:DNA methyltransferase n=1 Tax=Silvimonas sp. TaxID=2650811 RepID=UPI00284038A1|nr:DNA methyltransferase [Silvimonas sp.]MDR3428090.1 DNA methyltransferase [Silvimonas sp.]